MQGALTDGRLHNTSAIPDTLQASAVVHRLVARFPHVLPQNRSLTEYRGWIALHTAGVTQASECLTAEVVVQVRCPCGPADMQGADVQVDAHTRALLEQCALGDVLPARTAYATDLVEMLEQVSDLVERCRAGRVANVAASATSPSWTRALPRPEYYKRLLHDLERIGWEHVVRIDDAFAELELQVPDAAGRQHLVILRDWHTPAPSIHASLPAHVPLPEPDRSSVQPHGISLMQAVAQVRAVLGAYQPLFQVLDDVDQHSCVLEPERPTYATCIRRIALGRHCSLYIEVDPHNPRSVPVCRLLGGERDTAALQERLNGGLHQWDAVGRTPRQNLEAILECSFPPAPTAADRLHGSSTEGDECGICYSYRMEGVGVPDMACDYAPCARPYHRSCLWEWLQALPETRQSFQVCFGVCPYCSRPIRVRR
ncbi:hypothetical protein CDCA_CDCA03G1110 [Cyanidium caldarium]|uniref:Uncharacterized protein n=1 Tax=Cyanidium caldarium TaxID=2771 RepID=A0AAV9IS10_CYACA|nr:hypothetical protein CDCA_CDCA03G1110 [Cyanidium caldarium]